jgi:tetratricopeptide (TPR) repeat protein
VETLEAASSKCPLSSEIFDLLGIAYDLLGRGRQAQQAFRRAIELAPRVARPRTNLAVSLIRDGKDMEALRELEAAVALDPTNSAANANLASLYTRKREYARALVAFELIGAERSSAIRKDPQLLLQLTECLLSTGRSKRALTLIAATADKQPASVRFSLGTLLAEHGIYREAIRQFLAIPEGEADPAVLFNLGLAHSRLREYEVARRWYFAAIDIDPQQADNYFRVGLDFAESGDGARAIPWLLRARRMAPQRPDIIYALTEELIAARYFQSADAFLAGPEPQSALLETAKGDSALSQGKIPSAIVHFRRALELDSGLGAASVGLARAWAADQKQDEALGILRELLARAPGNAAAHAEAGRLEAELGNWKNAIADLEMAWAVDPAKFEVGLNLARCYRRTGQLRRALDLLSPLRMKMSTSRVYHYELSRLYTDLERPSDARREIMEVQRIEMAEQEGMRFVPPAVYIH